MLALALLVLALLADSSSALAPGANDAGGSEATLHVCAFEQAERLLRPMLNATLYMALLKHASSSGSSHQRDTISSSSSPPSMPAERSSSCLPTLESMRYALRPSMDGTLMLPRACGFEWFKPYEACQLLSTPPTTLLFLGDSITRHFMHAAQLLIRGDLSLGALREDLPVNVSQGCTCDRQFAIKSCRQWILKDTRSLTNTALPCPAARVVYIPALGSSDLDMEQLGALVTQEQQAGREVLLLLGGWGMHNGLKAKPVFRDMVQPLLSLATTANWSSVQPLCLGVHAVQSNVLQQHKHIHNNKNVDVYNHAMHSLCTKHGVPFFDTYAITQNLTSFDGIHYGMLPNLLKAQLLLNFLSELRTGLATVPRARVRSKSSVRHRSLLPRTAQGSAWA